MKHRDIQPAHEESVLNSFKSFLEDSGTSLTVLDRPDPPDAMVTIGDENSWVEVTDAFQSPDWAESLTSNAADDKIHKPYQRRVICEPDRQACEAIKEVILKKYRKKSMKGLHSKYGPGVLLVGAYTPMISPEEIIEQSRSEILSEIVSMSPIFEFIYLYRNSHDGHVFYKLL
ncbi:hypothetical protein [Microbulbifer sp. SAOS-129_SWC]|uniref:hypothetical protein n=1 Tax=Microbulbifer sp. SAOS-129_SWC TaxID=3145235 RepID=UPI0032165348